MHGIGAEEVFLVLVILLRNNPIVEIVIVHLQNDSWPIVQILLLKRLNDFVVYVLLDVRIMGARRQMVLRMLAEVFSPFALLLNYLSIV